MKRPRIGFLLGDPNGIGPEIAVKVLARSANTERADIVLYADPAVLTAGERVAGTSVPLARNGDEGGFHARLRPLSLLGSDALTPGSSTEAGGRVAFGALTAAAEDARAGRIDGIVFAPLNKHALRLAGLTHEDELRYLQSFFGVEGFVSEFNITGELWTSRVT